jgi:hypothetical protein
MGLVMIVEVTTTVAFVSEIHGCTPTYYVANAKISKLLTTDEAIELMFAKAQGCKHFSSIVVPPS